MTREEIAALLGITMETVSRQIGKLEAAKLIQRAGAQHIDIINHDRLQGLLE
jgi:CRP/FNR family transcriptional regulator